MQKVIQTSFGYAATANVQVFGQTSTRAEAPQVQSEASQEPSPSSTNNGVMQKAIQTTTLVWEIMKAERFQNIGTFSNETNSVEKAGRGYRKPS